MSYIIKGQNPVSEPTSARDSCKSANNGKLSSSDNRNQRKHNNKSRVLKGNL